MNVRRRLSVSLVLLYTLSGSLGAANSLPDSLDELGWKERSFSGHARYTLVDRHGTRAIQGHANATASALYQNRRINLEKTPILRWQWQVGNTFDIADERSKAGDDFPARVYVVYKKGPFPWNTFAINYVWSSGNDVGDHWPSAYTDKSHVVVLQTGERHLGQWMSERRNVAQDFKNFFGLDVRKVNGYAIMVDGDNTGSTATTWFADIDFSTE